MSDKMIDRLISRLPPVRGDYLCGVAMARHTWFGVGGPADVVFCPRDADDLGAFLAACPADIPILPVGAGSNLLVRDGGIAGVVIRLTAHMNRISKRVRWTVKLHAMQQRPVLAGWNF
jgi:UDP-N-acetylmuramate dehydrogenase